MNKFKISVSFIVGLVIVLFFSVLVSVYSSDENPAAQQPPPVITPQAVAVTEMPAVSEEPVRTDGVETDIMESQEYVSADMKINDLDPEVLQLLGDDKEWIARKIRIFANEYGFAGVTEVTYYGETILNHNEGTVSTTFYFRTKEIGTYKFNLILSREKKTVRFEPW